MTSILPFFVKLYVLVLPWTDLTCRFSPYSLRAAGIARLDLGVARIAVKEIRGQIFFFAVDRDPPLRLGRSACHAYNDPFVFSRLANCRSWIDLPRSRLLFIHALSAQEMPHSSTPIVSWPCYIVLQRILRVRSSSSRASSLSSASTSRDTKIFS